MASAFADERSNEIVTIDAMGRQRDIAAFTTVKHMVHNLIRNAPGKNSLRLRRKVAVWDDDSLVSLVAP